MTTSPVTPEDETPELDERPSRTIWAWLVGTVMLIGRLRPGSGTWASLLTAGLWFAFARYLTVPVQSLAALAIACAVTIVGIPASTIVEQESGVHDPGFVVIDEVAGQMIALIGAPLRWPYVLAAFILFRAFDILKPPPLRRLEKFPQGAGIMLDDVGAGFYALLCVQLLAYFKVF